MHYYHQPPPAPPVAVGQYVRIFGQLGELAVVVQVEGRLAGVKKVGTGLVVWWEICHLFPVR